MIPARLPRFRLPLIKMATHYGKNLEKVDLTV
jgi:hypothetical protein